MAVSQVIIGKPGGLTISEGLAMNLFPIFITAIPGQESENVKALAARGIGIYTTDTRRIRDIVLDLKKNPEKLHKIKENIKKMQKPDAAREICNVVCQSSIRPSD
jgi:processive 1,2-diacylglycerol beta-glucosyltransferase